MINYEVRYKMCHVRFLDGVDKEPNNIYDPHSKHEIECNCYDYRDLSKKEADEMEHRVPGGYFLKEYLKRVE